MCKTTSGDRKYKEFLVEGKYTVLEYVKAISHTVGSL